MNFLNPGFIFFFLPLFFLFHLIHLISLWSYLTFWMNTLHRLQYVLEFSLLHSQVCAKTVIHDLLTNLCALYVPFIGGRHKVLSHILLPPESLSTEQLGCHNWKINLCFVASLSFSGVLQSPHAFVKMLRAELTSIPGRHLPGGPLALSS